MSAQEKKQQAQARQRGLQEKAIELYHERRKADDHPGDAAKAADVTRGQILQELRSFKSFSRPLRRGKLSQRPCMFPRCSGAARTILQIWTKIVCFAAYFGQLRRAWTDGRKWTPLGSSYNMWQPVRILGMSHRHELEGATAEVIQPGVDEQGRVCVRLIPSDFDRVAGEPPPTQKVMRVLAERLLPLEPKKGRPRPSEAVWMIGEVARLAPVEAARRPKQEFINLKALERQVAVSQSAQRKPYEDPLNRRQWARKANGTFYKAHKL